MKLHMIEMIMCCHSLEHAFQEVDADSFLVLPGERAPTVALDHARLADGAISDDHHLVETRRNISYRTFRVGRVKEVTRHHHSIETHENVSN